MLMLRNEMAFWHCSDHQRAILAQIQQIGCTVQWRTTTASSPLQAGVGMFSFDTQNRFDSNCVDRTPVQHARETIGLPAFIPVHTPLEGGSLGK